MGKQWKIAVIQDTAKKTKGGHGTHLAFAGLPDVQQVLVDPNHADLSQRMAAIGAVRHYSDARSMLVKECPDIMVICSRLPDDHFELIDLAGERGCHVFCEKPMSASLAEADAMAELAKAKGIKIAVAHLARYALVFRTMQRMIRQGAIGTPLTFYGRGKEDDRGGGEDLMVLGTHILDLGAFFFGLPEEVSADVRVAGRRITAADHSPTTEPVGLCAGDSVWANLRFAEGVNGVFESRRNLCTGPVRMGVTVAGTEGTLSVRYDQTRALRISHSSLPPEDEAHGEVVELQEDRALPPGASAIDYSTCPAEPARYFADANRFAALDLMQAIVEDRQPACSVHDAVAALEMIYGIYRSSIMRAVVPLPLEDRTHPLEQKG